MMITSLCRDGSRLRRYSAGGTASVVSSHSRTNLKEVLKMTRLMFGLCMMWGLTILGCGSSGEIQQLETIATVEKGNHCSFDNNSPQLSVIRNEEEWGDFWNLLYANQSPKPDLPVVDFSEKVILSVVDISRPNSGYSIAITRIEPTSSGVTVHVSQSSPGRYCVTADQMTRPYHIVTTPKFSGEATLLLSQVVHECSQ